MGKVRTMESSVLRIPENWGDLSRPSWPWAALGAEGERQLFTHNFRSPPGGRETRGRRSWRATGTAANQTGLLPREGAAPPGARTPGVTLTQCGAG